MSIETTYKGKIEDWDRLHERLTANAADLAHLDGMRTMLETALEQTWQLAAFQAAQTAAKQQASKSLKTAVVEGDRLANLLRSAVKQHYGIRSEKLAEFGVKPFRGRKKADAPEPAPMPAAQAAAGSGAEASAAAEK